MPRQRKTTRAAKYDPVVSYPKRKIGVVVVDDHTQVRQGLISLLKKAPNIVVLGEASDGRSVAVLVQSLHPDVVIMDVKMPGLDGIQATRLITSQFKQVRVIGWSMCEEAGYAAAMRAAGAVAFLPKYGPTKTLITAILASASVPRKS